MLDYICCNKKLQAKRQRSTQSKLVSLIAVAGYEHGAWNDKADRCPEKCAQDKEILPSLRSAEAPTSINRVRGIHAFLRCCIHCFHAAYTLREGPDPDVHR